MNERRAGGAMDVRVSGRGGSRDGNKEPRQERGKKEQIVKIKERKGEEDCVRWRTEEFMKCDDLWRAPEGTKGGKMTDGKEL